MVLAIEVELLTRTYEAGLHGERTEWPPHPSRLFCALASQAQEKEDWDALEWLEEQDLPVIDLPSLIDLPSDTHAFLRSYVPTNKLESKRAGTTYVARTNGVRRWFRAHPIIPWFRLVWLNAQPSEKMVRSLEKVAARVAYLGRPSGMVIARVSGSVLKAPSDTCRLHPATSGRYLLRVPYEGYLKQLVSQFEQGRPAHAVSHVHPYAEASSESDEVAPLGIGIQKGLGGPYSRLVTLGFPPGSGVAGWHALRVADALRRAVLSRLGRPAADDPLEAFAHEELAAIHGHAPGLGPAHRCAFMALPDVGGPYGKGDLLGVGIAVGSEIDKKLKKALLMLLGFDWEDGTRIRELWIRELDVRLPLSDPDDRWSLQVNRWIRPDKRWATVFPLVLERWPKRNAPVAELVAKSVVDAGYPEPVDVEVRRGSAVTGAPFLRPGDRKRRPEDLDRLWTHVVVSFNEPVSGPILLGHLRFTGLGLCVPAGAGGERANG
jgi:CRISPR-associated protein Csb2